MSGSGGGAVAGGAGALIIRASAASVDRPREESVHVAEDESDAKIPTWLSTLQARVLVDQSNARDVEPVVGSTAEALAHAGLAPERVSLAVVTMHPGVSGLAYVWNAKTGKVAFFERELGFLVTEEHLVSPLHYVMSTGNTLFLDAHDVVHDMRFPIVKDFVKQGATSYLALPLKAARGDVHVLAMWTARQGGWSQAQADEMAQLIPLFTLCVETAENRRLLGIIGTAHEVTQRALAEQALQNADELLHQQRAAMERLEAERDARLETERLLAERNAELAALAVSLEAKVSERTSELEAALEKANAANQARSRFLAMMSHEIRTPFHAVLGFCELLAQTDLEETQAHYVETIQTASKSLLALLNNVLDFSKIEAGRMELERFTVDPARLLDEVATLLGISARERGIALEVRCGDDVPPFVEADPTRLRQVFMNLLGNAVKFTEVGSVTATLEVASMDDHSCTLRGRIADTGPGIPADALDRLFEPFTQADGSMARRFGGTGLGLSICKELLEQMGGTLSVESQEGVGTTFTFLVPVGTPTSTVPRPETPAQEPPRKLPAGFEELRVLVVDDNRVNRMVAERQLRTIGVLNPAVSSDGPDSLLQIQAASNASEPFDIVLMDVMMPGQDGLETTRLLRQLNLTRQPRVVALTANAFEADRRACMEAGMDDFLPKPVSIPSLKDALLASIGRDREEDGLKRKKSMIHHQPKRVDVGEKEMEVMELEIQVEVEVLAQEVDELKV